MANRKLNNVSLIVEEVPEAPNQQAKGPKQSSKPSFDPLRHRHGKGEVCFVPGNQYLLEGRVVDLKAVFDDECVVWDGANAIEISCQIGELELPKQHPESGARRPANMTRADFKLATGLSLALIYYKNLPEKQRTNQKIAELAYGFGISGRTLRRRFEKWDGRLESLLSSKRGPFCGSKRLDPKVERIVATCIDKRRRCNETWTIDTLVEDIRSTCESENASLMIPCKRTIGNRLARSGHDQSLHRKHGHAKARHKESSYLKTYDPGLPLSQVQIDHTRIDLMVWDTKERVWLKRPWLTLVIDSASRVILGFHLSFDPPSVDSVVCALLMAMLPKHQILKQYGVEGVSWDSWGKPKEIQTDWAQEFRSRDFRQVCLNYQIKPKLRPFAAKHWGGRIERLIGTMMAACHMLPGTTFSSPKARDGYDAEAKAKMDLVDIRAWLINQIILYNNTPHSSLMNRTPMQCWKHLLTTKDGEFIPPALMEQNYYMKLEYDLLPRVRKRVQRDHINWNNRPYNGGIFSYFKNKSEIEIKYHPDRLRTILFMDRHGTIHYVPTSKPPTRELSLSEERAIATAVRQESAADVDAQNQRQAAKINKAQIQVDAAKKTRSAKNVKAKAMPSTSTVDNLSEGDFEIPTVVIWN